jgi:hypothetical protein
MWVWFFGLSISLFLVIREYDVNNLIALIPLFILSSMAVLELLFRLCKYPKCSQWREWINTGFLADLSITLVVMVSLQIYNVISFSTFYIVLTCIVALLSLIFVILRGQYTVFTNSPMNLRVANIISYICSVLTYLFFYGVEYGELENWIPLIPFCISVIAEIYIVLTLYNGIDGIQSDFSTNAALNRLVYMSCIFILLLVCILHYVLNTPDVFLYSTAAGIYFIGIVIMGIRSRKKICKQWDCFEKPKYNQLKNQDINIENGVTNDDD